MDNDTERLLSDEGRDVAPRKKAPFFKLKHPITWYLHPRNSFLGFLLIILVAIGTTNRVMFKKMTNKMPNYPYFLSQFTTFIYLPIFWPVVWYLMHFTNKIPAEQRKFPWWKFAVMGLLDSLAGLLLTFGGVHTSGPMQLLLSQGAIPLTMIFTWVACLKLFEKIFRSVLNIKYRWNHYLGATIIIVGIAVALSNKLTKETEGQTIPGMIIFFAATIPTAFSGVYKEVAFKGADLEVNYVNAWVATWQAVFGILLAPITFLPGFGSLPPSQIGKALANGGKCFVGINSSYPKHDPYFPNTDDCNLAFLTVGGYTTANVVYNIVLLLTIKHGSAALLYIASAMILPLADICFTISIIMGRGNTSELSIFDIIGLVVILVGLILYRLKGEDAGGKEDKPYTELDHEYGDNDDDDSQSEVSVASVSVGSAGIMADVRPTIMRSGDQSKQPRSTSQIRTDYMSSLGLDSNPPLHVQTQTYDEFS